MDKGYHGRWILVWEEKENFRGFSDLRGFFVIDLAEALGNTTNWIIWLDSLATIWQVLYIISSTMTVTPMEGEWCKAAYILCLDNSRFCQLMNSFKSITTTSCSSCSSGRGSNTLERENPVPYFAPYLGYKGHFDQNEKIGQDYGCTRLLTIDGCFRLATRYASMPVKNRILIYEFVFRPAIWRYGIWD